MANYFSISFLSADLKPSNHETSIISKFANSFMILSWHCCIIQSLVAVGFLEEFRQKK